MVPRSSAKKLWRSVDVGNRHYHEEEWHIVLDPNSELADLELSNNVFPKKPADSKFDQFKNNKPTN